MDVGGKLLTNQLKEVVSYRQWNMMDETFIMNHAKEACCYVSTQFIADLETCRHVVASLHSKQLFNQQRSSPKQNSIVMEYLLPNFSINRGGEIRRLGYELTPTDQVLVMENERFTIPELLYRPDDIGWWLKSMISHTYRLVVPRSKISRAGTNWTPRHDSGVHCVAPRGSSGNVLGKYRCHRW